MNQEIDALTYKYPIPEHNIFYSTLPHKNIYVENSWILIPTRLVNLINDFVLYKLTYGSQIEQSFYKTMNTSKMIKRMFKNRPLGFMNSNDYYILQDGTDGMGHWESIGTNKESEPLVLSRYMSYDELELSSFLSISIFTSFINRGSRKNWGKREEDCQPNGIYIGQVGPRFQKQFRMEWKFMIVDPEQNTPENGYGSQPVQGKNSTYLSLWANFYDIDYFPLYTDVEKDITGRYFKLNNGPYLDILIYKKRIRYSAELFLKEANYRAMKIGKQAFCHTVGLGLGVWKI